MPRWKMDELELLLEALWDKGYETYPSVVWPIPGLQVTDPSNEDKEMAYRRGCCDAIESLVQFLANKGYLSGCERLIIENHIKMTRKNNGL